MLDPISATAAQSVETASAVGRAAALANLKIADAAPTPTQGISFAEMLGAQAESLTTTLHGAEAISAKGMTGETGSRQVADAVMEAERSMQAAVVVRDKIVSAWLDVSRMAI